MEEQLLIASAIMENTSEGIIVTDQSGVIQMVNSAFTAVTGYKPEEVIGKKPNLLNSGRHSREFYASMWEAIRNHGRWQGEIWNKKKNGEVYLEWLTISAVKNANGTLIGYTGIFSDMTERRRAEEEMAYKSTHDLLTGLSNRLLFAEKLKKALAEAADNEIPLAVVMLDLDRFNNVNDSLGQSIGDQFIRQVAKRLKQQCAEGDDVARIGGDEFAVMLTRFDQGEDVVTSVRRLASIFEESFSAEGHDVHLTASMGVSVYPLDGENPETLLTNADTAMYRAKEQGGSQFQFYTADMNQRAAERLQLENGLYKALEREEFVLYYQPQLDVAANRIVGMEALIRWNHPELGLVNPSKFVPLAEETGFIIQLGAWVLETACRQCIDWQKQGLPPVRVSINLSARQLEQENLVEAVAQVLEKTNIDPACLELEVTESIAMRHVQRVIETLHQLKSLGVSLSIDDFGTGYSSLSYLTRLPIHTLKIDQSFVRNLFTNPEDDAVVKTIVSLAHNLNLKVIAEGVDSPEQLKFLRSLRCDIVQGYLLSRPLPAGEVVKWWNHTHWTKG